jgi:predicted membrane protein
MASMLALWSKDVLEALALSYKIWAPAVVVPLCAASIVKKPYPVLFYAPSFGGIAAMLFWEAVLRNPFHIPGTVFGIIISALVCMAVHWALRRRGG